MVNNRNNAELDDEGDGICLSSSSTMDIRNSIINDYFLNQVVIVGIKQ